MLVPANVPQLLFAVPPIVPARFEKSTLAVAARVPALATLSLLVGGSKISTLPVVLNVPKALPVPGVSLPKFQKATRPPLPVPEEFTTIGLASVTPDAANKVPAPTLTALLLAPSALFPAALRTPAEIVVPPV